MTRRCPACEAVYALPGSGTLATSECPGHTGGSTVFLLLSATRCRGKCMQIAHVTHIAESLVLLAFKHTKPRQLTQINS
jgi:hypothetical protein